jgi:hypothetical protein
MPKKKKKEKKPEVHESLEGLDITINEFGQIISNYDISKLNEFLNSEVDDKKLKDRKDIPGRKKKKK